MGRRNGAAARAKANAVRVKLEAQRKERDDRIVACVEEFAAAQETIEELRAQLDTATATSADALLRMRAEGISSKEMADLLGLPKRDIDRMLRTVKTTTPDDGQDSSQSEPAKDLQPEGEGPDQDSGNDLEHPAPVNDQRFEQ